MAGFRPGLRRLPGDHAPPPHEPSGPATALIPPTRRPPRFLPIGAADEFRPDPRTDALVRHGVDPDRPSVLFVGRVTRQEEELEGFDLGDLVRLEPLDLVDRVNALLSR